MPYYLILTISCVNYPTLKLRWLGGPWWIGLWITLPCPSIKPRIEATNRGAYIRVDRRDNTWQQLVLVRRERVLFGFAPSGFTLQGNFFACDILDALPTDDLASMAHPLFSLATRPGLAIRALKMTSALPSPPRACIFHSNRGRQYCSHVYQTALRDHGLKASMSGKGNCYDDAAIETFFKTIKAELIWRRTWET